MAKKKTVKSVDKAVIEKEIMNGLCPICHQALIDGQIAEVTSNDKTIKMCKKHRLMLG